MHLSYSCMRPAEIKEDLIVRNELSSGSSKSSMFSRTNSDKSPGDADGGGPETLERQDSELSVLSFCSDDFIHKDACERDQEEQSGGTSIIDTLDGRLDEVRSSLTVPVDSMVQSQVADEHELHQKDAASVPTTSTWSNSGVQGGGIKRPSIWRSRKRTEPESDTRQDEARKRLKARKDHWKSLTSSERKALQDSILGEAQPQQTPEQEELCSSDEQFLPSPMEGDDEEDEEDQEYKEEPPRVCRHCNATQHGEESDARDHEAKCCAMQLSQLVEVEMVVVEEEVVEVGAEDIQTEPCSPAIVATAPEGSEDNPMVLD